jgi:hypothetical protein
MEGVIVVPLLIQDFLCLSTKIRSISWLMTQISSCSLLWYKKRGRVTEGLIPLSLHFWHKPPLLRRDVMKSKPKRVYEVPWIMNHRRPPLILHHHILSNGVSLPMMADVTPTEFGCLWRRRSYQKSHQKKESLLMSTSLTTSATET